MAQGEIIQPVDSSTDIDGWQMNQRLDGVVGIGWLMVVMMVQVVGV